MKLYTKLTFSSLLVLFTLPTFAQENIASDSVNLQLQQMQSVLNTLSKIKISGYIQAQFQVATAEGINTYEGGNFAPKSGNRFMVRRGRFKIQHEGKFSLSVLQIDATEKGVGVKDAYLSVAEPWTRTLSLTVGYFNRPFGFELPYSSSKRESPERGRMSQILFPGERDLGLMLSFQPVAGSVLRFIKIDAGLFNGHGAQDFDNNKDFIGRLRFDKIINSEVLKFSFGGSYYGGVWKQNNTYIYEIGLNNFNSHTFIQQAGYGNSHRGAPREYAGTDAQLALKWIVGTTTLRGEYIFGRQSGFENSTTSPANPSQPTSDVYLRNFDGGYFYFIQDILQSAHQLVVKYDWYDPNTDVEGKQIGDSSFNNLSVAEIKYHSIGFGWNINISDNIKFMAFYQVVKNEITSLHQYTIDVKDDVLTLRLQHKF